MNEFSKMILTTHYKFFVITTHCWSYIDTLVSGSPILQNGRLIGAVTHLLVDDPTKGYAIFAENMLETAQSVEANNKFINASKQKGLQNRVLFVL